MLNWTVDDPGTAIPIEQSVQTMVWSDEAPPLTAAGNPPLPGPGAVPTGGFKGTSELFQRLLGFTPELRDANQHHRVRRSPVEALFTARGPVRLGLGDDRAQGEPRRPHPAIQPYDLPSLRAATTLSCRCRATASTRRRRSWRCGTPTTATSTA